MFEYLTVEAVMLLLFLLLTPSIALSDHVPKNLRAWHTDGKTFLVWEHSDLGPPISHVYEIYASPRPINSIENASLVGWISSNEGINHRLREYSHCPNARWILPGRFGGSYRVNENEALFVTTSHENGIRYYAVVPLWGNEITLGRNSLMFPVWEDTDSVTCHIQYQDSSVTIYGHWIDGRSDPDSGRPGYPVMGNEHSNGIGFNFAVWEPIDGRPSGKLPAVIWLHGAGQSFAGSDIARFAPYAVPDGLFVTLDDPLQNGILPSWDGITFWLGYADEFNRFFPFTVPSDSATVIDYTARRVRWTIRWLRDNEHVDPNRISLAGHSMGGVGTLLHTQLRPDLYAAGIAYVPPLVLRETNDPPRFYNIFGTLDQNLPTNLCWQAGIWDILDQQWRVQQPHPDWPYVLIVSGKNDIAAPWSENLKSYIDLDSARTGYSLYWDEREHRDWSDAHFQPSFHLNPAYLTRFRNDLSFPAFSETDVDPDTPGRQPDPGSGDPEDGDPWGTWGGYLEWNTNTIVDTEERWECSIWVTSKSPFESDIPESDTIVASVTPRNLQHFSSQGLTVHNEIYFWKLIDLSNGQILQEGTVRSNEDGSVTVRDLWFSKDPYRLIIIKQVITGEGL